MNMESKEARRAAARQFKERKPRRGIFAVRSSGDERVWVGPSLNLEATKNSLWARLRLGGRQYPDLLEAWNAQGEAAFRYEVLEMLNDEVLPMAVRDLLKEKLAEWAGRLGARTLLG